MREITVEELRKIQLDILKSFADFCEENGLNYYLSGGTLLGAVRHKGYIPWDDDIDIMMPRKDYEFAMKNYCTSIYKAISIENYKDYWDLAGRIIDSRTLLNIAYEKKPTGVYIDVFPIDGVPKNRLAQRFEFAIEYLLIMLNRSTVLKRQPSHLYKNTNLASHIKNRFRTIVKYLMITLMGSTNPSLWVRLIHYVARRYPFDTNRQVAVAVLGNHGTHEIVSGQVYRDKILLPFENQSFWGPVGYDIYLRQIYGNDYMSIPPVDKRISNHNFKAYWIE